MTNLDNYTFLSNVDQPTATFGDYLAAQPDSGVATSGLPASPPPSGASCEPPPTLSTPREGRHARPRRDDIRPFDEQFRPAARGDDRSSRGRGSHLEVQGLDGPSGGAASEFTCWTSISDLDRKLFFLRADDACNYTRFDLPALAGAGKPGCFRHFSGLTAMRQTVQWC